ARPYPCRSTARFWKLRCRWTVVEWTPEATGPIAPILGCPGVPVVLHTYLRDRPNPLTTSLGKTSSRARDLTNRRIMVRGTRPARRHRTERSWEHNPGAAMGFVVGAGH